MTHGCPYYDPITTLGIDIEVGDKDLLYCFSATFADDLASDVNLQYTDMSPDYKTGIVETYRDDKLESRYAVPAIDQLYGLRKDSIGNMWVGMQDFEVLGRASRQRSLGRTKRKYGCDLVVNRLGKDRITVQCIDPTGKPKEELMYESKDGRGVWVSNQIFVSKNNEIFVHHGFDKGEGKEREEFVDKYSPPLKLLSTYKLLFDEQGRRISVLHAQMDDDGNLYSTVFTNTGEWLLRSG